MTLFRYMLGQLLLLLTLIALITLLAFQWRSFFIRGPSANGKSARVGFIMRDRKRTEMVSTLDERNTSNCWNMSKGQVSVVINGKLCGLHRKSMLLPQPLLVSFNLSIEIFPHMFTRFLRFCETRFHMASYIRHLDRLFLDYQLSVPRKKNGSRRLLETVQSP